MWTSPDGKTKNQIDHILISRQHRSTMMDTRVIRAADVGSDHYLLRGKMKLKLKAKKTVQPTRRRFKTEALLDPRTKANYTKAVQTRLNYNNNVESVLTTSWMSKNSGRL